jgi:predicted transcriptional regulator of viral defense system
LIDDGRVPKLIDYAHRLGVGSIYGRPGYLLELFGTQAELQSLHASLTATYVPLDPSLPREGSRIAKWRLQLKIPTDELLAVRST